ncbi:hypothetical protein D3C81_1766050 [compost metagenome]
MSDKIFANFIFLFFQGCSLCFFTVCQLDNLITLSCFHRLANFVFLQIECRGLNRFLLLPTSIEISIATAIFRSCIKRFALGQLRKIGAFLKLLSNLFSFVFRRYNNYRSTNLFRSVKSFFIFIKGLLDLLIGYCNLRLKQFCQLQIHFNTFK